MSVLSKKLLEELIKPGPRLPWIKNWLLNNIWTVDFYDSMTPIEYLKTGEINVNRFEELISSSADRIYKELLSSPDITKRLLDFFTERTAIVIFDGLSLREIPIIIKLAKKSGLVTNDIDCSLAAIPCETVDFIEREFHCGRLGPTQLINRTELKNKGISMVHTNNITQKLEIPNGEAPLLVWSAFPDNTYTDSGSKFENHFENIHVQFETAWINTVQQLKKVKKIIITSDHGYIFFGTGMDANRTSIELRELNEYFGNNRNMSLLVNPNPPKSDDLVVDKNRELAIIKGRVKTRSTGEAATRLYKHGGLSFMEMLTPWIVLEN